VSGALLGKKKIVIPTPEKKNKIKIIIICLYTRREKVPDPAAVQHHHQHPHGFVSFCPFSLAIRSFLNATIKLAAVCVRCRLPLRNSWPNTLYKGRKISQKKKMLMM
jgi:hypothetical protein